MDGEQKDYNPIPQVGQGTGDQERPPRGRGRGRGGRGRGRGARGGTGGARHNLPTAAQRAAELGVSSNASAKSGQTAPSLSALSKMIDAQYPVTAVNETTYQSILLDPHGYLHLAYAVYQELHMSWRHLHEYISPHEYMLVCCWALLRRIILVRSKIGFVSAAESDFLVCMPDITLPAVLAEYLDHVGLVQLPDQTLVYPDIIIPAGILPVNQGDDAYYGMLPVRLSEWDAIQAGNLPAMTMYSHLLPTGLIRRAFERHVGPPANAATYLTRFDPGNAQQIDGWLSRPKVLSFDCSILGTPSQQRIAANVFANVYTGESLFGAMNFNPDILAQYINVVPMIEKFVSLRPSTTSTKGSIAQVAYCVAIPRINHGLIDAFSFHSAINLTETELHAARTFRFRRRIHANHCLGAQGQDIDVALTLAPASIRVAAPIRISSINSPGLYVNYVCSLFMKARIDRAY